MDVVWLYLDYNPAIKAGLFFVLGVCFGSFVTALLYRLPRRLNWTSDRSRCTSCHHALGVKDLVPVLSWLMAGGKCRYCKAKISARYPLIEIAVGVVFAVISCL